MGEKAQKMFLEMNVKRIMNGNEGGEDKYDSSSIGTNSEDSMNSVCSSSSSELNEDACSSKSYLSISSSSSSSSHSNGPLFELHELMNDLPIKRGLSMFYQGKAQSFTSLARVQSIEDLPKKSTPYSKRMKSCKSFGGGLDSHRVSFSPKATIKKASRGSFASVLTKRGSFLGGSRPYSIAVHK